MTPRPNVRLDDPGPLPPWHDHDEDIEDQPMVAVLLLGIFLVCCVVVGWVWWKWLKS